MTSTTRILYTTRYRANLEKEEQRFVIKYFCAKGWDTKQIHEDCPVHSASMLPGSSDQNRVTKVQDWQFVLSGPPMGRTSALGSRTAARGVPGEGSICQFLDDCAALSSECTHGEHDFSQRVGNEKLLVMLGATFSEQVSDDCGLMQPKRC
jgi:hypothetical protein